MIVDPLLVKLKSKIRKTKQNIKFLQYKIQKEYETINELKSKIESKNFLSDFKCAWEYRKINPNYVREQDSKFEKAYHGIDMYIVNLPEISKRHHVIASLYLELEKQCFLLQTHGFTFVEYKCAEYHQYKPEELNDILKEHFDFE